jgi:plasmid stabilization system protein ParE
LKIHWSVLAKKDFDENIEYLLTDWNQKVARNFTNEVLRVLEIINQSPKIFNYNKELHVYQVQITKHIKLFYEIKSNKIILLRFWNNYKNPKSISLK